MLKTNLNSRVGKVYPKNYTRGGLVPGVRWQDVNEGRFDRISLTVVSGESPFVSVFEKLKKCDPLKLCNPESEFGMIENCKNCNKKQ
tara:strand:+ start:468 stop:728 length:261 start_codon:yes stop_codon:yes gene_type:complete